ncbi:MAG: AI-2E family transporter [Gammaproteobacteria bacterium]|nr:AI-2E family transporter [Gammaproteobacteria bacterium]MCY4357053.1 AI-2E family transporter [Gammaproteobacteria bacterium]
MKAVNYTAAAFLVVLIFYLLIVGESLLLPLVIAVALWYLINTLAQGFNRLKFGNFRFPMLLCYFASFLTFGLLIWALINFLSSIFDDVLQVAPVYQENLTRRLQAVPFVNIADFDNQGLTQLVTEWIDIPSYARSIASSFASILASGGLILIYLGFLFLEQGQFSNKISALVSDREKEEDARKIIDRIRDDIQKYIGIKVFTSSLTGTVSYGFLLVVGVDFAAVWGLLIFLLNFIPTVGSIIATIFPALLALAQSDGYSLFLLVLLGIGAVQICIGNILEPRLMGSSFNLSPIVILLNLALWGYIWNIPGMFLCVPFLIIVTIILSHFPQTRPFAIMLSADGKLRVPVEKTFTGFHFGQMENLLPPGSEHPIEKDTNKG